MTKAFDFIKQQCNGVFFLATINGTKPALRPFGALAEFDGELYIATSNTKAVYQQMKANKSVQICALKPGTHDWVRIEGILNERTDLKSKKAMLEACPNLTKHYNGPAEPTFAVFAISEITGTLFIAGTTETF
ncbi:MAG: pyridoxamine 5'-phosphate oxidase family protein [Phascolarctobacterium sp.]|nr:pyridoxamine 5'-phosphate oxidase family protein [Phascolarctobacterium sp.]